MFVTRLLNLVLYFFSKVCLTLSSKSLPILGFSEFDNDIISLFLTMNPENEIKDFDIVNLIRRPSEFVSYIINEFF